MNDQAFARWVLWLADAEGFMDVEQRARPCRSVGNKADLERIGPGDRWRCRTCGAVGTIGDLADAHDKPSGR